MATNDVNSIDIREAGRGNTNVGGHVKTGMLSRPWKPEHIRTTAVVQSHTLELLIVRSFAVSLYCGPVGLLPCKCKPRK